MANGKNLEQITENNSNPDISLKRIALTTLGYGIIGACFDDSKIIAPLTATIGFGASLYDEVKNTKMNLVWPAAGIFVGGLIGSIFDLNVAPIRNIISYTGASIGGILGFYKSIVTRGKE